MKCPYCDTENFQNAQFCRVCGREMSNENISSATIMDRFPKYNFIPTNLIDWKKPWLAKTRTIFFSIIFVASVLILCYSIMALMSKETFYIQYIDEDSGENFYRVFVTESFFGIFEERSSRQDLEEATEWANDYYNGTVTPFIIVSLFFACISLPIIIFGKRKYPSKNNKIKDVADYVEKYRYTGLNHGRRKPILKFYVKDNKMGLLDVAHYCVFLPAQYDKLAWREKNKYLNATLNDSSFVIDIYGSKLK